MSSKLHAISEALHISNRKKENDTNASSFLHQEASARNSISDLPEVPKILITSSTCGLKQLGRAISSYGGHRKKKNLDANRSMLLIMDNIMILDA